MCLDLIRNNKSTIEIMNNITTDENDYATMFKVFFVFANKISPVFRYVECPSFKINQILKANTKIKLYLNLMSGVYNSGFHMFINEQDAIEYKKYYMQNCTNNKQNYLQVRPVKIKKEWITTIGEEKHLNFCGNGKISLILTVIVTNQMIIPE